MALAAGQSRIRCSVVRLSVIFFFFWICLIFHFFSLCHSNFDFLNFRSLHTETAMHFCTVILGAEFDVAETVPPCGTHRIITCDGVGWTGRPTE
jgi:hypothetical protein